MVTQIDWAGVNDRLLDAVNQVPPTFRPTSFWLPGIRSIASDLHSRGLSVFKSWPSARSLFYPRYGDGYTQAMIDRLVAVALDVHPQARESWLRASLNGTREATRDLDATALAWDQERWPFDIMGFGESRIGSPPQPYQLTGPNGPAWTKPYLNYLLCLAALSRHVVRPPRSFLEIGGGFGVLGEILVARDPRVRYVNVDIAPMVVVSAWYLRELSGDGGAPDVSDVSSGGLVCAPNWRLPEVKGPFDCFINCYSFQEMEPDVVAHYVKLVSGIGVDYVVSLNSRDGKRQATPGEEGGVIDPVRSADIVAMFEAEGFELVGTYGRPLIISSADLVILRRRA